VELTQMIEALTANQMENLRTTVEYLWGKNYSRDVFNKSTLLKLMKELNFRQRDIEWGRVEGRDEGRTEGRAEGRAEGISVLKLMQQEGKITPEQTEYFIKRMEEKSEKKKPAQ
jgi:predicted transposase YdaD